MSEETNHGVKSVVKDGDYKDGEGCATKSHEQGSPVSGCPLELECHKSSTTGTKLPGGFDLGREVRESESVTVEESHVIR